MHLLVFVFIALAAITLPARDQTQMPAAVSWETGKLPDVKPVQIQLTADIIDRFIASLPDMIALARNLDRELGRAEQVKLNENLAFLLVPHLFDPKSEARINFKLGEFGFANYGDWANAAHSLALTMEAAEFTGAVDLGNQEQAARREIEIDTTLSPNEKAKSLKDLKSQFEALAEFEPLPGNREVAAPYLERLRAVITGG